MSVKRAGIVTALLLLTVSAGAAWAQGVITVSKGTGENSAMYKTIQEAVNAARPGQVIEIMDVAVYEEQVTIDGRGEWNSKSEWDGKNQGPIKAVLGGKNGITIKYTPPAGSRILGNYARPTIKWKDTQNTSPKNVTESNAAGELPGQSSNYETCGALRILWAQGVTIDGIKVDGGGLAPFENKDVWDSKWPLFHGNAAITLVAAGGTVIRNCDITSGYFGINVNDRNTGGVFGNPNPSADDMTIPLSGFGKVGNHLFEYNKIHNNMTGLFFESSWDLGSTIRYNLIYSNIHNSALVAGMESDYAIGGAILFRDMKYTPVAIYNNTFFFNTGNIMGEWKVGAPHLLFNNIFGKPSYAVGTLPPSSVTNASFEHRFPYRMHNSVFAAAADLKSENRHIQACKRDVVRDETGKEIVAGIYGQQISGITQVRISTGMPSPSTGPTQVECIGPLAGTTVTATDFIAPGGLLTGTVFSTAANIRWLETTKSIDGTEDLFVSTDPASADFLRPKWDHNLVKQFIKGQGWADIGMKNSDGTIADIGAISSTGRASAITARVKPSNIVLVNGTGAKASFFVSVEGGQMNNAKINFLRWVAPLPTNPPEPSGNAAPPVTSINNLTAQTTAVAVNSNNTMTFNIPALPALGAADTAGQYGFFEVAVSGKDASGNDVVSDIGFLPYRKLEYTLKMTVHQGTSTTQVTEVKAGEPYRLHVVPCKGTDPANCGSYSDGPLNEISYELQSDAAAFMYYADGSNKDKPFTQDGPTPSANMTSSGKDYTVYFTRAGKETIMGSGVAPIGGSNSGNRLVFFGTLDITVNPGAPAKAVFTDPIPSSQLGAALPQVINRGVDKPVTVEIQDKYDNAVDVQVPVSIVSDHPEIGDIAMKQVNTAGTTGIATFIAKTGPTAASGQVFEMTATFNYNSISGSDKGKLRVGRSLDRLEIFYSDTGSGKKWSDYYDPDVKIEGNVGDWYKITVKVVVGDSVNTSSSGKFIFIETNDPNLIFSATAGGAAADIFPLRAGVATFWVSAKPNAQSDIENAGISVLALSSNNLNDLDASIASGGRDGINFRKLSTNIRYAVVYGDGQGRPDSLKIVYAEGGASLAVPGAKPDRVTLAWGGVELSAEGNAIEILDDATLRVNSLTPPAGTAKPTGYTSVAGLGRGVVKVYGGSGGADAVESGFDVYDGIGPVLANGDPSDGAGGGSPVIIENFDDGWVDTLIITVSEELSDPSRLKTLLYTAAANPGDPSGATAGTPLDVLNVFTADGRTLIAVVGHTADGPVPGGWIRLDPSNWGDIVDRAAEQSGGVVSDNRPHDRNRWVQLKIQEVSPEIRAAWYTANSATGKPDYAYVEFNKEIDLGRWFSGGSVKFDVSKQVSDVSAFFSVDGSILRIDLSAATSFASPTSTTIRTAGDIPFTLTFGPGVGDWGTINMVAQDRAAPVLARPVVLKNGSIRDDGLSFNQDTLIVYYSESINAAAQRSYNPITLRSKDGGRYGVFQPELRLLGSIGYDRETGYYRANYLVQIDFNLDQYPEPGDYVHICEYAGIGDDRDPPNEQNAFDNLWQPLTIRRSNITENPNDVKFGVTVTNNPLRRGGTDRTEIVMAFNTDGRRLSGSISLYDNLGNAVDESVIDATDVVTWRWNGRDKKGRLVDAGSYFFKAVCNVRIGGKPEAYTVTRVIGVVSGGNNLAAEAIANAPSGGFTAGSNPVARASDKVGLFWDGGGINSGALFVYDASGNFVKRVGVGGKAADGSGRRRIGEWDLTDAKGRAVAEGSYVVTGAITAKDGKKRRVSAIVNVGK